LVDELYGTLRREKVKLRLDHQGITEDLNTNTEEFTRNLTKATDYIMNNKMAQEKKLENSIDKLRDDLSKVSKMLD
jgi:hypothetical protein